MAEVPGSTDETPTAYSDSNAVLSRLKGGKTSLLLQQVASLRARGIGNHISLPQLVVCGDQSAGKSSVLEGLTGLPFPRNDGLCTTFPTEIVFTHSEGAIILTASIIPSNDRSEEARRELQQYARTIEGFSELPTIISDVSALMKKTFDASPDQHIPVFVEDILQIRVTGNTDLHLTVVDLPGLISVPNEEQTENDVHVVHALVDSYCQNPRTIILAVVQAGNDIANQAIIQKSKKFDPEGLRTVGVITKPDLINAGTEGRIAMLARNEDTTKLKLGFFLVKNPNFKDLQKGISSRQRLRKELLFFNSPPWNDLGLTNSRIGIQNLQNFLQELLGRHFEKEMPHVRQDIIQKLERASEELNELGEERSTEAEMRIFLSRLAMKFHNLTSAALRGDYDSVDAVFFTKSGDEYATRLRAFVHNANTEFSNRMRDLGHTMRVITIGLDHKDFNMEGLEAKRRNSNGQIEVSKSEMDMFVKSIYRRTRGQELPGSQNHALLTELFHHDSRRWVDLTKDHVSLIADHLRTFLRTAINHLTTDPHVNRVLAQQIETSLLENRKKANEEVGRLCEDKDGLPMTYNHYYTDNVQKARNTKVKDLINKTLRDMPQDQNTTVQDAVPRFSYQELIDAVEQNVNVNMDDQACSEARDALKSYYKVARKTFVDNVCIQAIERHLLKTLPKLFSPETVAGYTADELLRIAGEDESTVLKRKELQATVEVLRGSLADISA